MVSSLTMATLRSTIAASATDKKAARINVTHDNVSKIRIIRSGSERRDDEASGRGNVPNRRGACKDFGRGDEWSGQIFPHRPA